MDTNTLLLYVAEYLGVIAVLMIAGLSPRMKPRTVAFRYPRREGVISLGLYALILLLAFIFYQGGVNPLPGGTALERLWQRLLVDAFCIAPFGVALVVRGQPLRSAGWGRATLGPAFRISLALVFLTIFLRGKFTALVNGVSQEEGYALLAWLGIAAVEGTIFRGYIQLRLSSWLGSNYGLVLTAFLYFVWQLPRLLADPAQLTLQLILLAMQALILGWIMRKSGNVFAPALFRAVSEWITRLS